MVQRKRSAPRARTRADLTILAIVGVLLIAAIGAGGLSLYRQFYGPAAFVERYLGLLEDGRAADALLLPGVGIDRETLAGAGIDSTASDALLRGSALASLEDYTVTKQEATDDGTAVTVEYTAGGHHGSSTFTIVQDGWVGVVPNWRFADTPLADVQLLVQGSDQFSVNGFTLDRRQIAPGGVESDPTTPVDMLVFTPGAYSVTIDTPLATSSGVKLLADTPLATTPIEVKAEATDEFLDVVQTRVEQFLNDCAEQEVLQPTGCPFGLEVDNYVQGYPTWKISKQPKVSVEPTATGWEIPTAKATAHISVDVISIFDGSVETLEEDVPFEINGTIAVLPDGSASIRVGSPEEDED